MSTGRSIGLSIGGSVSELARGTVRRSVTMSTERSIGVSIGGSVSELARGSVRGSVGGSVVWYTLLYGFWIVWIVDCTDCGFT